MKRPLPIGISDFKELRDGSCAYADKTLLIEEMVENGGKIALVPRPRRFGKTLNLSMLRYFFEKSDKDTSYLFKDLEIWKLEKYRQMQGQFPVVFLSFKDVKYLTWENTLISLRRLIAREFQRHQYLLEGALLGPAEKEEYLRIVRLEVDLPTLDNSLSKLTEWMSRYHQSQVIVLIDEYDSPVHAAYVGGFYEQMIVFLRNWLSGGLKDNAYVKYGMLTGILRIAKESIFSGMNNIATFTLLDEEFQDKFGLLESEVKALLDSHDLSGQLPQIRQWYDGYRVGSCEGLYNPWSVLCCIAKKGKLAPYWVNTSDNALIKRLVTRGDEYLKKEMEGLLNGTGIEKKIDEGIVFPDLEKSSNSIWSLLLFSGYLTIEATPSYGTPCRLRIPNMEVAEVYSSIILDWFNTSIAEPEYHLLLNSLIQGDIDTFSKIFSKFMTSSVSVFDVPAEDSEKIYHAFVLGLLVGLKGRYEVKSNRESGYGRYDVMLIPQNIKDLGIVLEFKKVDPSKKAGLEETALSALGQIEEKNYAQELLDRNIKKILLLGLAFQGKKVLIQHKFIGLCK
jgi:hypothetical protein